MTGLIRQESSHFLSLGPHFSPPGPLCHLPVPFLDLHLDILSLGTYSAALHGGLLPFSLTCSHNALFCLSDQTYAGRCLHTCISQLQVQWSQRPCLSLLPRHLASAWHVLYRQCVWVSVHSHVLNTRQNLDSKPSSAASLARSLTA